MDRHPLGACDESHDLVTGHGGAALGQFDEHVRVAVDDDVAVALPAGLGVGDRQILSGIGDRLLGPAPQVDESIDNRLGTDVVLPHGCVEGVDVAHAQFVGNGGEVF